MIFGTVAFYDWYFVFIWMNGEWVHADIRIVDSNMGVYSLTIHTNLRVVRRQPGDGRILLCSGNDY